MNEFLKSRADLNECTDFIKKNGLIEHGLSCKNFDIAKIVPSLTDGDILDMGASGSWVLENAVKKGIKGRKVGIDLAYSGNESTDGIELVKGDLMNTPFENESFQTVCCLSVVEHEVDFDLLAMECSRLLLPNGKLFMTYDYWPTKRVTTGLTLYGLQWNILDLHDVLKLVEACKARGLELTSEIDWTVQDAVIDDKFCAPFPGISYTFGILEFINK